MHNSTLSDPSVFAGVDVSARELVAAVHRSGHDHDVIRFPNTAAGHHQLIRHLVGRKSVPARVCLEASGNYSLDLCLALDSDTRIELSVVNPRHARRFAESLGKRSKTDPVDARVLREHARRMPCSPWHRPSPAALQLRSLTRTMEAYTKMLTQDLNRDHALSVSRALSGPVRTIVRRHRQSLLRCRQALQQQALRLIASDPQLALRFHLLQTITGIKVNAALPLLAELALLPPTLDARQWVAHAGLDPRHFTSGTSVAEKPRISRCGNRHLRRALYMPALVAATYEPGCRAFYRHLLENRKLKLQALTAVMRKLLHGIYGMFQTQEVYNPSRLFPRFIHPVEAAAA